MTSGFLRRWVYPLYFICFIATSLNAQTDYRPGYVVNEKGDTLLGNIQFRESVKNFRECTFKPGASDITRQYIPTEIKAWHIINDAMYRSIQVPISQDDSTLVMVFAEVLVEGKASLFKFESRYFVEKEATFYEMRNKRGTLLDKYGIRYRTNSFEYIGVLNYLFSDCQSVAKEISQSQINENKLTKVVNAYNLCTTGKTQMYKSSKKWIDLSLHIVAGYQFSSLSFSGVPSEAEHLFGTYDVHQSFVPLVLLEFVVPRINERISFTTGISYRTSEFTSHIETNTSVEHNIHDVKFAMQQLTIPTGFRFYLSKDSFSPYLEVGFSSSFYLKTTNYWRKETTSTAGTKEITEGEAIPFNKHQFGIWGGAGIIKELAPNLSGFITLRLERTNGFTRSVTKSSLANSQLINTQIAVGIRFE